MPCFICGSSSCATWMHSAKQQSKWNAIKDLSERQLQEMVIDLQDEVYDLRAEIDSLQQNNE